MGNASDDHDEHCEAFAGVVSHDPCACVFRTLAKELQRTQWRIHDPQKYPNHYYVFTNENDAHTALLALNWAGHDWKLDDPERGHIGKGSQHGT